MDRAASVTLGVSEYPGRTDPNRGASVERWLNRYEYSVLSTHVLTLAARSGCSAYDCEFVALAQDLEVPLVTSDRQILKAFPTMAVSPSVFTT